MLKVSKVAFFVAASMGASALTSVTAMASEPVSLHNNKQLKNSLKSQLSQNDSFFRVASSSSQSDFEFRTHTKSADGKHLRRSQYYKGVRVYGGEIVTHHEEKNVFSAWFQTEGEIKSISGSVITKPSIDTVIPSIDADKAIAFAKEQIKALISSSDEHAELIIFPHNGELKLAYLVSILAETQDAPTRPEFTIDAHSGAVLNRIETLHHTRVGSGPGGNEKSGLHHYGTDKPHFHAKELGNGQCEMSHTDIRVIDMEHGTTNTETFQFPCYENTHKSVNGAYSPLNDAMYYGQATIELFKDWFDSRALTGDLVMRIHYREDYLNAFWNGKEVTFGDGDLANYGVYPFTSLGVVAHEIGHGVTHQNSKLVYSNMSGGVNEAFSDMTSEALECYMNQKPDGSCEVDWLIGASIFKNRTALRYMANPEKDGHSIGHADKFTPGMGVHSSSGVFNKAFYLLANTPNWGVKKAYEVMYNANKNFWVYNGNFESLACGVTASAKDLGYDIKAIGEAFKQVGVFACTENKAPTISLTSPNVNERFIVGTGVTITANAQDDYGRVEKVEFFVNGQLHATDTQAPFETKFTSNNTGQFVVAARATDNDGAKADAQTVSFTLIDPSQCNTAPWQGGRVYTSGQKVSFDGFEYEAKWWNRDRNPGSNSGSWGVWKKGLECGGVSDKPNQAPSVQFISPLNNTEVEQGQSVNFNLDAKDSDGDVKLIEVTINGQLLTRLNSAPYQFNWKANKAGSYRFSAMAKDDKGATTTAKAVTVLVNENKEPTPTAPEVTLLSPSQGQTVKLGERLSLTVSTNDKDGDLKQVAYFVNGKQVSVSTQAPYAVSFTANQLGNVSIYAVATDATGLSTQSKANTIKVVDSSSDCAVAQWSNNKVYTAGNKASLNGELYEAKWWTRGQNPAQYSSQWAVWKKLGACN
ncbi:Ig-like domain-containing protein [Pseudoalteromonas sp. MTN2-4]|uniref:Ig-like domain-containing protein n=1 Tax=Pseudoalteromonas sp. MTN2-4 TaxID=3056555 RepID=UPI0036F2108E